MGGGRQVRGNSMGGRSSEGGGSPWGASRQEVGAYIHTSCYCHPLLVHTPTSELSSSAFSSLARASLITLRVMLRRVLVVVISNHWEHITGLAL